MKQRDNVSGFELFPEGHYEFTVESRPEKFKTPSGKATYRKWQFGVIVNGQKRTFKTALFAWNSKSLLLALGGVVCDNGEVEWDDEEVIGKKFTAEVVHEPDFKGVTRAALKDIRSDIWSSEMEEDEENLPF